MTSCRLWLTHIVSGLIISHTMTSLALHHVRTVGLPFSDRENNMTRCHVIKTRYGLLFVQLTATVAILHYYCFSDM